MNCEKRLKQPVVLASQTGCSAEVRCLGICEPRDWSHPGGTVALPQRGSNRKGRGR
jgi:hypothetical protein